ncbi:MAG: hypothetical protein H7338_00070 [Candidatus Sericytochromatia bacterium]|nr:hypothetical protein [Candidatus Sericytochromatia bacterium]
MPKAKTDATPVARKAVRQQIRQVSKDVPVKAKPSSKKAPQTRIRRSPTELLADLKAQRDEIARKMGAGIARLDEKIARTEERYEKSLKLAEFAEVDVETLSRQLEETKRNQRLLRLALKRR